MLGAVIHPVHLALSSVCTDIADIRWFLKLLTWLSLERFAYGLAIHFSAGTAPSAAAFLAAQTGSFAAGSVVAALSKRMLSRNFGAVLSQFLRHMTAAFANPLRYFCQCLVGIYPSFDRDSI
jgi:hypothetical protein